MGILSWIIVGVIASWLAGEAVHGSGYGLINDILIGIAGALLGGFLSTVLFHGSDPLSGVSVVSLVVAFLGSVVLIMVLRVLKGSRA